MRNHYELFTADRALDLLQVQCHSAISDISAFTSDGDRTLDSVQAIAREIEALRNQIREEWESLPPPSPEEKEQIDAAIDDELEEDLDPNDPI